MNISEELPIEVLLEIVFDEDDNYGWSSRLEARNSILRKFAAQQSEQVDGAKAPQFQRVLPADVRESEAVLPDPPRN